MTSLMIDSRIVELDMASCRNDDCKDV